MAVEIAAGPPGSATFGPSTPNRSLKERVGALKNLRPFLTMVWRTSRQLTAASLVLRLIRAVLPVVTLFVGKLIIDSVPSGAADMNLDRKETIAGHPIKKVRDFLKNHFNDEVDVPRAQQLGAEYFGDDSDTILAELSKRGWLEEAKRTWKPALGRAVVHATYNRTQLGQQVAIAKLIARFSRVKGDAILTALVERAYQINANPELCTYIKQLRLFGSMLDSSVLTVGDVDVAVELGRRKPPLHQNGVSRDWVEWNIERFEASGRTGGSFLDRICYGDIEVMRLLKSRVAGLSLHSLEDLNSIGAPSAPLFEISPLEIARFEVPTISQGRE